jgi:hypothetical protein
MSTKERADDPAALVATSRRVHREVPADGNCECQDGDHNRCWYCCEDWPCPTARLADALEQAQVSHQEPAWADWNSDSVLCVQAQAWKNEAIKQRNEAIEYGGVSATLGRGLAASEEIRVNDKQKDEAAILAARAEAAALRERAGAAVPVALAAYQWCLKSNRYACDDPCRHGDCRLIRAMGGDGENLPIIPAALVPPEIVKESVCGD